jgi:hypothetical protein
MREAGPIADDASIIIAMNQRRTGRTRSQRKSETNAKFTALISTTGNNPAVPYVQISSRGSR